MGNIVQPLWAECSACTRLIVVGYPALSVALLLLSSAAQSIVEYGFICNLDNVVHSFCVWTMMTSTFYRPFGGGMSFLMMLFEIYMGMQLFPAREKELGSTTFLLWVFLMNFCVSAIFLLVMFLITLTDKGDEYWGRPTSGLWPLIFICITVTSLADPTGSTSFWGVVSIPNKWYPICLFLFFCMMSQGMMWNIAAALVIGYGYNRLRLERLLPSRVTANSMEQRCCGANGRACLGTYWVRAVDTAGYELESGDRRYATLSDFGRSGQGQQQLAARGSGGEEGSNPSGGVASNFQAFAGSGNRLGDGSGVSILVSGNSAGSVLLSGAAAGTTEAKRPAETAAAGSSARELGPEMLVPGNAPPGTAPDPAPVEKLEIE